MKLALFLVACSMPAATVKVRQGNTTLLLPLERYVAAVLRGESSVFRSNEALKAMAVAARDENEILKARIAALEAKTAGPAAKPSTRKPKAKPGA